MDIGEKLYLKPTLESSAGFERPEKMPCTVVYIHPLRRFFVVEFVSEKTGQRWRETFYFKNRQIRETAPKRLSGRHTPTHYWRAL